MTRRNAENQQTSYWSHPGYNRADAVRALDELLACPDQPSMTFLNMSRWVHLTVPIGSVFDVLASDTFVTGVTSNLFV